MSEESLEAAIARAGGAVEFLRNAQARPHTFPVRPEFSNWRSEQTLLAGDLRAARPVPPHDRPVPRAGRTRSALLERLAVNSFATFTPGKAKQYVAVNPDGFIIGDAILFHLPDGSFDLVGHPMVLDWVEFHAVDGAPRRRARARRELDRAHLAARRSSTASSCRGRPPRRSWSSSPAAQLPDVKFFNMASFEIAGLHVDALRHGMAGQPGFELFGPWEQGERIREALLAGRRSSTGSCRSARGRTRPPTSSPAGCRRRSRRSSPARRCRPTASGCPPPRPVRSPAASLRPNVSDYYLTPYELGYGKVIAFDHDFVGREALEAIADAPSREKVTLRLEPRRTSATRSAACSQQGDSAKFIELPKARYGLYQVDTVLRDGEQIGVSHDCGYIYNEKAFVSLASIDTERAPVGSEVTVLWGESPNSTQAGGRAARAGRDPRDRRADAARVVRAQLATGCRPRGIG